jgi:hypothetical protein
MPGGTALVIDFTLEYKYINSWHHLISYNKILIIIIFGYEHVKRLGKCGRTLRHLHIEFTFVGINISPFIYLDPDD